MLAVAGEQASRGGERSVIADRGEGVCEFSGLGDGIVHAIRGQQREMECLSQTDCNAIAGFFLAMEVTLEFDMHILRAEDSDKLIDGGACFVRATLFKGCGERT